MACRCRICKAELTTPLLELKNVPAAAQLLPRTETEIASDRGVDLCLYACPACGVVQHTGAPVHYFREVIRASAISDAMKQFRLEQFSDWLRRRSNGKCKVFEAGCGAGEYLALLRQCGAEVCGMEYSSGNIEKCRQQDLPVWQSYFDTGLEKHPEAPFDGFMMLNFLEHIPDIPAFLAGVRNNLADNGYGLVEIPNFDMIIKNSMLTEFSSEHLYYFTAETLRSTLSNNGFEVLECRSIWHDYILSAEVIKRPLPDLSGCRNAGDTLAAQLRQFCGRHRHTAFWGAGHQALTVLALCGMNRDVIKFVIDSSPAKQGAVTYVTHIPIVSPDFLESSQADSVVVCCGGYTDEVVKILQNTCGSRLALAAIRENRLEVL